MRDLPRLRAITPAGFAGLATRGRWSCPPHLDLLNRELVDVARGRVPRLQVNMPPRHGKSELATIHFAAWYLGTFPDRRVVIAAHTASLARQFSRRVRDALREFGEPFFGVKVRDDSSAVDEWNLEGRPGGLVAVGVGGSLTGKGADLLIIDDPVKDALEAQSTTYQERAFDWYQSTSSTRLSPVGAIVLVMTRWNALDLGGRVLGGGGGEHAVPWRVVRLPALAEGSDALGRAEGESLWPGRYPREKLLQVKAEVGEYWFAALYQQRPSPREGGFFKRAWLKVAEAAPPGVESWARGWDLAATEGAGDWTVGAKVGRAGPGLYVVSGVERFRLGPGARDRRIAEVAKADGRRVKQVIEQEPGSAGKAQVERLASLLEGYSVRGRPSTGDKGVRADPVASLAERGGLILMRGDWNDALIEEFAGFPRGEHDDQVDAVSAAYHFLAKNRVGRAL